MPVTIEPDEEVIDAPDESADDLDMGSLWGRCPVCGKHLRPRDKNTDVPAPPPVGQGYRSRAKCDRCHSVIVYIGKGDWVVWDGRGA